MKNRLVLFLWIVIFSCSLGTNLYAQSNAGAQKIYVKALAALNNQETEKGIQLLESSLLIDSNFVDSYISLFQVYLTQKQYKKAISNFEKAYSKDSLNSLPYIVKYANAYASIGDFNKAFEIIQPFSINAPSYLRQSIEDLLKICTYAIKHQCW
jgi:tetratricopeptide (TPR) repeat protein